MPRHGDEDEPEPAEASDFVGWTLDPQNWGRLSTAVESALPEDVRQSLAELRQPGGCARAARWLLVALLYAALGVGLWYGMLELYFGSAEADCQ
eukprot:COSAG04_NODE_3817_length_2498_cov_49.315364_2_plen_93_part_01